MAVYEKELSVAQWDNYFKNQLKGQVGGGSIKGFVAPRYQSGKGFGSILGGLLRMISPVTRSIIRSPVIRSIGNTIKKEALKSGIGVANDLVKGRNFKNSIKTRGKKAGKKIMKKSASRINKKIQTGRGKKQKHGRPHKTKHRQRGRGVGVFKRRRHTRVIRKNKSKKYDQLNSRPLFFE